MANKLDIVVFGATGFTGKFTLVQVHKLAKQFTWGVAGRNESKLRKILAETAKRVGVADFNSVPVITADVEDEDSIKKMTAQAKLVINCCGPYDLYGEVVVKSCIETETHYVDVTAEIHFIERILQKYGEAAENKGLYIITACGMDCVPTDLGICFMENNFAGTINSVETYMRGYEEGGNTPGALANYGTWASVVLSIGNTFKILNAQRNLMQIKGPSLKPRLSRKLLQSVDGGWALPLPIADETIAYCSQQFFYKHSSKRPIQMLNYAVVPSLIHIFIGGIVLLLIWILGQFKFGQNLLLKYPDFFSCGIFTRLPSEEKMERMCVSVTLKCQGWSDKLINVEDQYQTPPNKEIIGRIILMNPGYGFTCIAVTLSALMILSERKNLPIKGGVLTTAAAFSKTSLVQQLQDNGTVFEILSVKDI